MLLNMIDVLAGKWFDWRVRQNAAAFDAANPELMFKRAEVKEDGRIEVLLSHPSIPQLADDAAAILDETNSFNFFWFDMMPRPDRYKGRKVRVTIQWTHMKSPEQKSVIMGEALTGIQKLLSDVSFPMSQADTIGKIEKIIKLALLGVEWKEVVGE